MDIKKTLAANVARFRRERNLSQIGLAQKCPTVSQSTVSRVENGEVAADMDTVGELAQALGVSAWQLLSEDTKSAVVLTAEEAKLFYDFKQLIKKA